MRRDTRWAKTVVAALAASALALGAQAPRALAEEEPVIAVAEDGAGEGLIEDADGAEAALEDVSAHDEGGEAVAGDADESGSYAAAEAASVTYRTHVQKVGWQGWVADGAVAGTSGRALRLEAMNVRVAGLGVAGGVEYRTHVQKVGWQGWVRDGALAGTSGRALRLEAVQVRLYGEAASKYDVWYRVHAQRLGWLGWTKNGERAGTSAMGLRLEAIQIRVVPKGAAAPGDTARPFATRLITYRAHVQRLGWQQGVGDGEVAGTTGRGLRVEALALSLGDAGVSGGIEYRAHVQSIGWQPYVRDGAAAGTVGRAKRVEAVQVRLYGEAASKFDVWYRVHAQSYGWMGWTKNDGVAGTVGRAKRVEAVQVRLLPKDTPPPGSTERACVGGHWETRDVFEEQDILEEQDVYGEEWVITSRMYGATGEDANGFYYEVWGECRHEEIDFKRDVYYDANGKVCDRATFRNDSHKIYDQLSNWIRDRMLSGDTSIVNFATPYEKVVSMGPRKVKTGTKKVKVSTKRVKVGTEQVWVAE